MAISVAHVKMGENLRRYHNTTAQKLQFKVYSFKKFLLIESRASQTKDTSLQVQQEGKLSSKPK
jgi:hypothetical protein